MEQQEIEGKLSVKDWFRLRNKRSCKLCPSSREMARKSAMEHIGKHLPENVKIFGCPYCPMESNFKSNVNTHTRIYHPAKKFRILNHVGRHQKRLKSLMTECFSEEYTDIITSEVAEGLNIGKAEENEDPDYEVQGEDAILVQQSLTENANYAENHNDNKRNSVLMELGTAQTKVKGAKCGMCGNYNSCKQWTRHVINHVLGPKFLKCTACDFQSNREIKVHQHLNAVHKGDKEATLYDKRKSDDFVQRMEEAKNICFPFNSAQNNYGRYMLENKENHDENTDPTLRRSGRKIARKTKEIMRKTLEFERQSSPIDFDTESVNGTDDNNKSNNNNNNNNNDDDEALLESNLISVPILDSAGDQEQMVNKKQMRIDSLLNVFSNASASNNGKKKKNNNNKNNNNKITDNINDKNKKESTLTIKQIKLERSSTDQPNLNSLLNVNGASNGFQNTLTCVRPYFSSAGSLTVSAQPEYVSSLLQDIIERQSQLLLTNLALEERIAIQMEIMAKQGELMRIRDNLFG